MLFIAVLLFCYANFHLALRLSLPKTQPDPKRDPLCGESSNKDRTGTETACVRCGDPNSQDFLILKDENVQNLLFDDISVCIWRSKDKSPCGYMYSRYFVEVQVGDTRAINVARAVHPLICSNTPGNSLTLTGMFDELELVAQCSPLQMISFFSKSSISQVAFVEYTLSSGQHLHTGCQIDCSSETVEYLQDSPGEPPTCKAFSETICQACGACHKYESTPASELYQCLECSVKKSKYAQFTNDMLNQCKSFGEFYRGIPDVPDVCGNRLLLCNSSPAREEPDPIPEWEFYLTPDRNPAKDCFTNFQCLGTYADPFDDFTQILEKIECKNEMGKYKAFKLKINLLKGANDHFFLDSLEDESGRIVFSYEKEDLAQTFYKDRWLLKAFDLLRGSITIKAAVLGEGSCDSALKCFTDMYPYASDGRTIHSFHKKKKKCCVCDSNGVCSRHVSFANCECNPSTVHPRFLKTFAEYGQRTPGQPLTDTYEHLNLPHGLFNLKFTYSSAPDSMNFPELEINNCEFLDFYFHRLSNSLVSMDRRGSSILRVYKSNFINNLFLHGCFTNAPQYYMRNNPFIHPESDSTFISKTQKNFDLVIEDSWFENSGVKRQLKRPASACSGCEMEFFHEGMVLFLVAFDGRIGIRRNTFRNLVAYMRKSNLYEGTIKNDCMFQKTKDEKIPADRQPRVHIDKLIYSYMESREDKWDVGTSSVIQIRHMLRGLSLYENLFEANVGLTGTGVFIFMFKQRDVTNPLPIIIKGNTFRRNSALQFGHSLVIWNNDFDYYSMNRLVKNRGILVTGNIFSDNAGCFKTYGNVIIALSPFKIAKLFDASRTKRYSDQELFGYNFHYAEYASSSPANKAISEIFQKLQMEHISEKPAGTFTEFDVEKTIVNMQACAVDHNIFTNNVALISNAIYLQGCTRVYFDSNTISDNSIPIPEYLSEGIFKNSGYTVNLRPFNFAIQDADGGPFPNLAGADFTPQEKMASTTSSPVIFHLSSFIKITNCLFKNNSMLFDNDLHFGVSITFESMLGGSYQILNCRFLNNIGIDSRFRSTKNPTFLNSESKSKALTTNPLITFIYIQSNTQDSQSFTAGNNDLPFISGGSSFSAQASRAIDTAFVIKFCVIENNSFNLPSDLIVKGMRVLTYPHVALLRIYENEESYPYLPTGRFKNSYVNEICPYSMSKSFLLKIYYNSISFNTVLDRKILIFPRYFNQFYFVHNNVSFNALNIDSVDDFGAMVDMNYANLNDYSVYDFITVFETNNFFSNVGAGVFSVRYGYFRIANEISIINGEVRIKSIVIRNHTCSQAAIVLRELPKFKIKYLSGSEITSRDGLITIIKSTSYPMSDWLALEGITADRMISSRTGCFGFFSCTYVSLKSASCSNVILTPKEHVDSPALNSFAGCLLDHSGGNLVITKFSCQNVKIFKETHGRELEPLLSSPKATCFYLASPNPSLEDISCASTGMSFNHLESSLVYGLFIKDTTLNILNGAFYDNKPVLGVLFLTSSIGSVIKNTYFQRNFVTKGSSVINIVYQSVVSFAIVNFESNRCEACLGVIKIIEQSVVNIENAIFNKNLGQDGVSINCVMSQLTISKGDFMNNEAVVEASCIKLLMSILNLDKCRFEDNSAKQNSFTLSKSGVKINKCIFINNNASLISSNIHASECPKLEILFTEFSNYFWRLGARKTKGDFLNIYESDVTIRFCKFINGLAEYGGAIYFSSSIYGLVLRDCTFANNSASFEGGAIYAMGNISLIASIGQNNTAGLQGCFLLLYIGFKAEFDSSKLEFFQGINIYLSLQSRIALSSTVLKATSLYSSEISCVGLYCLRCASISVQNSSFISLRGAIGGAVVISNTGSSSTCNAVFARSVFKLSRAQVGAAIYVIGLSQIILESCSFFNNSAFKRRDNSASGNGGAIYFDCNHSSCFFNFTGKNSFIGNLADVAGGAHIFKNVSFTIAENTASYLDNQALYGNNQAAYAVKLVRIEDPPGQLYESFLANSRRMLQQEKVSGGVLLPPPVFKLLDEFGQQLWSDNSSLLTVAPADSEAKDSIGFNHKTSFQANRGFYVVYPFSVLKKPGSNFSIKFTSDAILQNPFRPNLPISSQAPFESSLRLCKRGEKLSANSACITCPRDYFSIAEFTSSDDKASCLKCPPEALCEGGDKLGPRPGYWRLNRDVKSFIPCLKEDVCLGSYAESGVCTSVYPDGGGNFCETGWCAEGYRGNLCAECAEGYALEDQNSHKCVPCESNSYYYLRGFGIFLISLSLVVITIRNSILEIDKRMRKKEKAKLTDKKMNDEERKVLSPKKISDPPSVGEIEEIGEEEDQDYSSIYLKILFNYLQILSVLGTFEFNWPVALQEIFKATEITVSSPKKFFSFDCLLKQSEFRKRGFRLFYTQLLLFGLSPFLFTLPMGVFWVLYFFFKYRTSLRQQKERFQNYFTTSLVIILYLIHPNIVDTSFQAFSILSDAEPGKEKWFLDADPEVECWTDFHKYWSFNVATPALLFWGAGIPLVSIIALWRSKSRLDSEEVKSKLGFLYEGYKNEYFYWELIILYRKMMIVFSSVFLAAPGIQIQASFVLGVCTVCFLAQIFKNPYKDDVLNEMERRSLLASSFTLYSSLYFFTNISKGIEILIIVIDLVLNLYFLLFWAKEMLRQKSRELTKNKLINLCCKKSLGFFAKLKKYKAQERQARGADIDQEDGEEGEEDEERDLFKKRDPESRIGSVDQVDEKLYSQEEQDKERTPSGKNFIIDQLEVKSRDTRTNQYESQHSKAHSEKQELEKDKNQLRGYAAEPQAFNLE